MNDEHDICVECLESADRLHDDVDCFNCGCKGCRGFTIAPGNVIQVTNGNTVVNKFKGEQNYDYH